MTPPLHVVLVHGVGSPEPGSLLESIEKGYNAWSNLGKPNIFRTYVVGEAPRRYHGVSPSRPEDAREVWFWDCNWSDINKAPERWREIFPFLVRMLVVTVIVAARGWKGPGCAGKPLFFAQVFRWLFSSVLLWITVLPVLSLAAAMLKGWWVSIAAALAIAAALLLIAFVLRKVERLASIVLLVVAVVVVGLMIWHLKTDEPLTFLLGGGLPPALKVGLMMVWPALIALAFVEGLVKSVPWQALVSRIGLLILAFALFSGTMAVVLALALKLAVGQIGSADPAENVMAEALAAWSQAYACSLPFHIAPVEYATGLATLFVGILIAVVVIAWILDARKEVADAGETCRRRLRWSSCVILVAFGLVACFIVLDMFVAAGWFPLPRLGPPITGETCKADLLEIYSVSAFRLLPFLGMVVLWPARMGFDVAADILFYLHDGSEVRQRLRALVGLLGKDGEVAVWGHSQGARVAVDALFSDKDTTSPTLPASGRLATSGAPVQALYGGFLNHADLPNHKPGWTWSNFWRDTDFVGGNIRATKRDWPKDEPVPTNRNLHHTFYWIEPDVISFLLDEPRPAPTS